MEEVICKIRPNGVHIEGDSGTPPKTISIRDFNDAIGRMVSEQGGEVEARPDEVAKDPHLLPPNVYLFAPRKSGLEVGMYYPSRVIPEMKFNSKVKKDVILPNIVISVRLKNASDARDKDIAYKYSQVQFWATDRGVLSLPTKLIAAAQPSQHIWAMPLPNMYSNGNMCFGGNSVITTYTKDLRSLHSLYTMIHASAFNSDLSVPSVASGHRKGPEAWLSYLSKKAAFPYETMESFKEDLHKKHTDEIKFASI